MAQHRPPRVRLAPLLVPGLLFGAACGLAVGIGWLPPGAAVFGALVAGLSIGWALHRRRRRAQQDARDSRLQRHTQAPDTIR